MHTADTDIAVEWDGARIRLIVGLLDRVNVCSLATDPAGLQHIGQSELVRDLHVEFFM